MLALFPVRPGNPKTEEEQRAFLKMTAAGRFDPDLVGQYHAAFGEGAVHGPAAKAIHRRVKMIRSSGIFEDG
jgi:hypothetical protein